MIDIEKELKEDEGLMLLPYKDTKGVLTIGYGRNLEVGITPQEAQYLLRNDINKRELSLSAGKHKDIYEALSYNRKQVLIMMCFNLGYDGLLGFVKMWSELEKAVQNKDFSVVCDEMLNSLWAKQLPKRSKKLSKLMLEG